MGRGLMESEGLVRSLVGLCKISTVGEADERGHQKIA